VKPRSRLLALAAALIVLSAHLVHQPKTLEDIDSINFALGVESFDVIRHQPHPPGYPLFIGLANVSTAAVGLVRPGWDRDRRAATGLAIWGALACALGIFVFATFWREVGLAEDTARLAAIVTVTAPLFWLTASRPLTDVPGLVLAVAVQVWLLRGLKRIRDPRGLPTSLWMLATFAAGLIVGFRSQSMWLTGPFIVWGVGVLAMQQRWRAIVGTIAAGAAGVLLWLAPLMLASGVDRYLTVVWNQSADDFAGPHMLAVSLTWRRFATYMGHTFVNPWQVRTFAHVVAGLALIGGAGMAWRRQRALAIVLVGFLPYLVFHLAFQETITTRYALPLVVPVAGLAVAALASGGPRLAVAGSVALVIASLVYGEPRLSAYAADGAPAFRAFQDMQRTAASASERPVVKMHHQVWWAVRRVADWYRPVWDIGPQPFPGDREVRSVVEHFRSGNRRPVWFLAHLPRSDLAAFDHRTSTLTGTYVVAPKLRELIGGARTDTFAWWSLQPPGWMLGPGWSLTPELAGMTGQDRALGNTGPAEAYVRRQPGALRVLVGGRYLGPDGGPASRLSVSIDDRPVEEWLVSSNPRWFVRWLDVPDGSGQGADAYARLRVRVTSETGGALPPVGLEQFDAAPPDESMYALTTGWWEQEQNPDTGLFWRWTTGRSTIEVRGADRDRTMTFSGESPLKYFDTPLQVTIRAGDRVLGTYTIGQDFSQSTVVPADALKAAGGVLTIETNKTFKPADKGSSPDQRDLGLRLYAVSVK